MDKPIGFLEGTGGTGAEIKDILKAAGKSRADNVLFDTNAKRLLKRLEQYLVKNYGERNHAFEPTEDSCEFCQELGKKLHSKT